MTTTEPGPRVRISWAAVVSFVIAMIWYVGWAATLVFGLLTHDIQGWNWLPYIVWGMWGLPALILSLIIGVWSIWRIRKRPQQLQGQRLAWFSVIGCLVAGPVWYGTQYVVVWIRQLK